jgi:hypothetical protein
MLLSNFNNDNGENIPPPIAHSNSNSDKSTNSRISDEDLAAKIAASLKADGLDNLEDDESDLINNCKRGKNEKKYSQRQLSLEKKWFNTIEEYGGKTLAPLLQIVPMNHDNGASEDYAFYNIVGGEKTHNKHSIMNSCLMLMTVKWKVEAGKDAGNPLQPSSFAQYMKVLFYLFSDKGIQYKHDKDFNRIGEFHGVLIDKWNAIREKDPSYGIGKNKARVDPDFVNMFIKAIKDGVLKPYENREDLLRSIIFINGYYLGLRGASEQSDLLMCNVYAGVYQREDGDDIAGLRWCGVKVPFSKTSKLNLKHTKIKANQDVLLTFVEDSTHDCWDSYDVYMFYLYVVHPEAERVLCRPCRVSKARLYDESSRYSEECGKDIWFCPSKINGGNGAVGHNTVGKHCQMLAKTVAWITERR